MYPITYTHHMQESMVGERRKIEDKLRKKQSEVAALEEKLKAAKVYVSALRDILTMLEKTADDDDADGSETKLRAGSAVAQAREIILARGEPVHLDDLLAEMGKEVTRATQASLAGSLAAYVRRDEIFTRPAPNTFGLEELGHVSFSEEDEPFEPPAGFGRGSVATGSGFADDLPDDVPF